MLCPKCKTILIRLPMKLEDGQLREIWLHPKDPMKKCDYEDGCKVNIEVVDNFMMEKFQELIKAEGIESSEITDISPNETVLTIPSESNEIVLKRRMCAGDINYYEYDQVKQRLE